MFAGASVTSSESVTSSLSDPGDAPGRVTYILSLIGTAAPRERLCRAFCNVTSRGRRRHTWDVALKKT